jgi:hypothetical protein
MSLQTMSLQTILDQSEDYNAELVESFSRSWNRLSLRIQKELTRLFQAGEITNEIIQHTFDSFGFSELAEETVSQYSKVMKFSKEIAKESGYSFILTDENIQAFDQLAEANMQRLLDSSRAAISDLRRFSIESLLEGRTPGQIISGFSEIFEGTRRRLETEIYTAIRSMGASLDLTLAKNAGIEKYIYLGPADDKTREVCLETLDDERQETGWTLEEINTSETPFIDRGGWNCRHRWIPFA